jgi:hypothetical protein
MKSGFSKDDIVKILQELETRKSEYPPELLAARRAAFLDSVDRRTDVNVEEGLLPGDQKVVHLLQRLKALRMAYPAHLFRARRAAFKMQVAKVEPQSWFQRLRTAVQAWTTVRVNPPASTSSINVLLTSLIALSFIAFVGLFVVGSLSQSPQLTSSEQGILKPTFISASETPETKVICKPGYAPPLCLARAFNMSFDLTFPGNGSARPAVAKDTLPGYENIHSPAFVNDGMYGPGTSWISNSANSWIKIDLGKATTINTITFGRDRLGKMSDRNPGQFTVAVALDDDVYANGNSQNDDREYTQIFNSKQIGFNGKVTKAETIQLHFTPLSVRYIKITFQNAGTAIDEVEAFMLTPSSPQSNPTKTPKEERPPHNTATPLPTNTPLPTKTPLPTSTPTTVPPTDTLVPTSTDTPVPTDTLVPTDTPVPPPTDTPVPTDTLVPTEPPPTETPIPLIENTPTPTDVPPETPFPG